MTFSPSEELRRWREEVGLASRLLCDADRRVAVAYGAAESPEQERPARVSILIGPDGRVAHTWSPADAAAHPAEVLAHLDQR